MATKPQSNLPPQAQPWGRYVEESIATLERGNSINGQNSNNNLRQLNSSVQLLSQQQQDLQTQQTELEAQQNTLEAQQNTLAAQQAYLATFTSYVTSDPSTVSGTTLNATTFLRQVDLSFTLSRNSKVLIEAEVDYNASLNSTGWATLWSLAAYFYIDSPSNLYGTGYGSYVNTSNVPTMNVNDQGRARLSRIVDMSAGSHFIRAYWNYVLSGNSGSISSSKVLLNATVVG